MSRCVVIFLVSACCNFSFAQGNQQLTDYYRCIYQAEQDIINKDYTAAAKQYECATSTGISMFAIDANNAAVCAAHNKDYTQLTAYAKLLIGKGASLGFFRKGVFDDYLRSKEWKALKAEYPTLEAERNKRINKDLVAKVNTLVNRDQRSLQVGRVAGRDGMLTSDSTTHHSIMQELKTLMEQHSYLSEEVIGADFSGIHLSISPLWGILALNHFNHTSLDKSVENKLGMAQVIKAAIKAGKLRPEVGVDWIEQEEKVQLMNTFQIMNDTLRQNKCDEKMLGYKSHWHNLYCDECAGAKEFAATLFLDSPANIRAKTIYQYHQHQKKKTAGFDIVFPVQLKDFGRTTAGDGSEIMYQVTEVAAY